MGIGTAEWEQNKLMFGRYETLELKKEFLEGKPETYYQFFRITSDENESLKKALAQSNVFLINRIIEDFKKKNLGLLERIEALERELEAENLDFVSSNLDNFLKDAVEIAGAKIIKCEFKHYSSGLLRKISDLIKSRVRSYVAALFSIQADKVAFVLSISDDLVGKGLDAGATVKALAGILGGGGGGKKGIAEAGGHDPTKIQEVFDKLVEGIKSKL